MNKIEIRLGKVTQQGGHHQKLITPPVSSRNPKEETKSAPGNTINQTTRFQTLKDIFDHFEIAVVKSENVIYNHSSKSVMLTFHLVSEHKAKNQLLYVNT